MINYISSGSFHTLTHWQSNGKIVPPDDWEVIPDGWVYNAAGGEWWGRFYTDAPDGETYPFDIWVIPSPHFTLWVNEAGIQALRAPWTGYRGGRWVRVQSTKSDEPEYYYCRNVTNNDKDLFDDYYSTDNNEAAAIWWFYLAQNAYMVDEDHNITGTKALKKLDPLTITTDWTDIFSISPGDDYSRGYVSLWDTTKYMAVRIRIRRGTT